MIITRQKAEKQLDQILKILPYEDVYIMEGSNVVAHMTHPARMPEKTIPETKFNM